MDSDADLSPDALRAELAKPGRSQSALARLLGKDPSAVNKIVAGLRSIKAQEATIIRQYLVETAGVNMARTPRPEGTPVTLTQLPNGKARLQVNKVIPYPLALKVLAMIEEGGE